MTDIIDAHHHIWRRRDLPWLDGPMQPRIFGPYEPIRRDYLIDEYLADLAGTGVVQIGLRAMQLAEGPLRGRSRLRPASRRRNRLPARHRRLRGLFGRRCAAAARPANQISGHARIAHAAAVARRTRNINLRRCAGPGARSDVAEERRAACRLRLVVRPAGVRRPDAGRRRARRQRAEGDVHPAARRHDRRPFARGLGRMAQSHAAPGLRARTLFPSFRRSAPSFTRTIRRTSPPWCTRRSKFSDRNAACSARIFQSRNCGRSMRI